MNLVKEWYQRTFSDPQAIFLALVLLIGFIVVIFWGGMLAPLLASVIIAYLLEAVVSLLEEKRFLGCRGDDPCLEVGRGLGAGRENVPKVFISTY